MATRAAIKIGLPIQRIEKRNGAVTSLVLYLVTGRGFLGGIESIARAGWVGPSGAFLFAGGRGGDFHKEVHFDAAPRVTQDKINLQHGTVFTLAAVDALKREVMDFYREVSHDLYTYKFAA